MELVRVHTKKGEIVVAPIGDFQWAGRGCATASGALKAHIARALKLNAYFIGMGDYIDFMSPSNRQRHRAAGFYDTANKIIWDKAKSLAIDVYEEFLAPTKGRWLGLLEGHHFCEHQGETTDTVLAELLDARFLGTSAMIRLDSQDKVLYVHHGVGGGILPSSGLNKLYHTAAGWQADAFLMGHNTKLATARISRPYPVWEGNNAKHTLRHDDVLLVNTGGFSRSSIVGHRDGAISRGDYAEQAMMTPSPISAPLLRVTKAGIYVEI